MKKIFICGSIAIKELNETIKKKLDDVIEKKYDVLVGDAEGIDKMVQEYLGKRYKNVTIYHIGDKPRNCISRDFSLKHINYDEKLDDKKNKQREKQQFKDRKMIEDCDISYCIWNGKSKGTYENIIKILDEKKDIEIYLNQEKEEKSLSSKNGFQELKNKIMEIYTKNNGYSLSEIYEILKEESNFQINDKKFKELLEEYKLIRQEKINNKNIYSPVDKKYGIVLKYKNQISSYRYTEYFIDLIRKTIKTSEKKSKNYRQNSLFEF
ncbi:MAG: hypothetical protein J1E31_06225 [Helicobacter sp.]|nr:hypothetical protein [Helicobacter sp.]